MQPDLRLAVDESNGYRVLQPGTLELADAVAAAAHARCAELGIDNLEGRQLDEFSSAPTDGKAAWTVNGGRIARLLDKEVLSLQSPLLRFALHPDLLTAVSVYLGFVPILSAMDIWVSMPSIKLTGSQHFHCDWADDRQIRVFVYATDVIEESGPLVVVDAALSNALRQTINYRFDGRYGVFCARRGHRGKGRGCALPPDRRGERHCCLNRHLQMLPLREPYAAGRRAAGCYDVSVLPTGLLLPAA